MNRVTRGLWRPAPHPAPWSQGPSTSGVCGASLLLPVNVVLRGYNAFCLPIIGRPACGRFCLLDSFLIKMQKQFKRRERTFSTDGAGAIGTYGQNKQIGTRLDLGLV